MTHNIRRHFIMSVLFITILLGELNVSFLWYTVIEIAFNAGSAIYIINLLREKWTHGASYEDDYVQIISLE